MWGCTGETEVGGKGKDRRKDGKKKSQKNKREEEERGGLGLLRNQYTLMYLST